MRKARCKQVDPHQGLDPGAGITPSAPAFLPPGLDLAHAFDHQVVVRLMRPAMQRQAQANRGFVGRGQQQAVAAKIVETRQCRPPDLVDQYGETAHVEQLTWQQMVALQAGTISCATRSIDRSE